MAFTIKTGDVIREIEWVIDRVNECSDMLLSTKCNTTTALVAVIDELKGAD